MVRCTGCGKETKVPEGAEIPKFCMFCGHKFTVPSTSPKPPASSAWTITTKDKPASKPAGNASIALRTVGSSGETRTPLSLSSASPATSPALRSPVGTQQRAFKPAATPSRSPEVSIALTPRTPRTSTSQGFLRQTIPDSASASREPSAILSNPLFKDDQPENPQLTRAISAPFSSETGRAPPARSNSSQLVDNTASAQPKIGLSASSSDTKLPNKNGANHDRDIKSTSVYSSQPKKNPTQDLATNNFSHKPSPPTTSQNAGFLYGTLQRGKQAPVISLDRTPIGARSPPLTRPLSPPTSPRPEQSPSSPVTPGRRGLMLGDRSSPASSSSPAIGGYPSGSGSAIGLSSNSALSSSDDAVNYPGDQTLRRWYVRYQAEKGPDDNNKEGQQQSLLGNRTRNSADNFLTSSSPNLGRHSAENPVILRGRPAVVNEIISTEEDYVKDLRFMIDVYLKPLEGKRLISKQTSAAIFSNVAAILNITQELLNQLKQGEGRNVGAIFLSMADFFRMYSNYCSNQPTAEATVDEISANSDIEIYLLYARSLPEGRSLDLKAYLIKPIQRICKYPLLLKALIEETQPDHPDYKNLKSALEKITKILANVNTAKAVSDVQKKLVDVALSITGLEPDFRLVDPPRRFLGEGSCQLCLQGGKKKDRHMFLFSDIVLLCKPAKTFFGGKTTYQMKEKLFCDKLTVSTVPGSADLQFPLEFIHFGSVKFWVNFHTAEDRLTTISVLNKVVSSNADDKANSGMYESWLATASIKPLPRTYDALINGEVNSPPTPLTTTSIRSYEARHAATSPT